MNTTYTILLCPAAGTPVVHIVNFPKHLL